jgi:hypothetical protein
MRAAIDTPATSHPNIKQNKKIAQHRHAYSYTCHILFLQLGRANLGCNLLVHLVDLRTEGLGGLRPLQLETIVKLAILPFYF